MEQSSSPFLSNLGSGVAANALFVLLYIVNACLKKRVKHSECDSGCFTCKTDISNTERSEANDDIV